MDDETFHKMTMQEKSKCVEEYTLIVAEFIDEVFAGFDPFASFNIQFYCLLNSLASLISATQFENSERVEYIDRIIKAFEKNIRASEKVREKILKERNDAL